LAIPARAEVSTERGSSIIIFPKLIYNGTFDTVVQISNTSNSVVYAHCFYVDASLSDPTAPPGPDNPPLWQEVDFDIVLTKQQPTHWVVSVGRTTNPFDEACALPDKTDCNDAGFDPGRIPPVPPGFTGELKCIEVDLSGAPISGNHLKGEATLLSLVDSPVSRKNDASKYNAIGILGLDTNDTNNVLCLGGEASPQCPAGPEYEGCPNQILASHYAEGARNPVVEAQSKGPSSVATFLTVVPCAEDFEFQIPASVRVQFEIYNEFEEPFSTSTTVTCWGDLALASINPVFGIGPLGSRFVNTRMRPAGMDPGFVAVMEEFHTQPGAGTARSALNLHVVGQRPQADLIVIPGGP